MNKKMKFELNRGGVSQLLKSAEMQSILEEEARNIKNSAGEGYEQDTFVGKNRANTMVYANTYQSKKDNYKNNTLLKAVHR